MCATGQTRTTSHYWAERDDDHTSRRHCADAARDGRRPHVSLALLALAMGGFAIGTTEFMAMGLLPQVADGVDVSIPSAGHLISAYALGVVVGAPVLAFLGARLPRRGLLVALMVGVRRRERAQRGGRQLRAAPRSRGSSAACRTAPTSASRRWSPPAWPRAAARVARSRW